MAYKKAKKKKVKSLPALTKEAQRVFNKWIRHRDSDGEYFKCISDGRTYPVRLMNAGHYVPVSISSFLRFHEWNVNGESAKNNAFNKFHLVGYRKRLIKKIGEENVEWLEANAHKTKKWSRSELEEIISKYSL